MLPPIPSASQYRNDTSKPSISSIHEDNIKLPSYSSAYRGVPLAGGIPIDEVMKRMEIEKLMSREERLALNTILKNNNIRDKVLMEIQKLEIGSRQRSTLKRLRMLIKRYRRRGSRDADSVDGATGQDALDLSRSGRENIVPDTKAAILQVVGSAPVYSEFASAGVLLKCRQRLQDFISQYGIERAQSTQFAIIVGSGSCNPVTRMHIRKFFIAKQCIESSSDIFVLGSLLSPAHPHLVRQRFRSFTREIIPAPHRLAVAQLSVKDSIWVSVDPWEITRRRVMDYLSLLEHVSCMIQSEFLGFKIKTLYLFKANMLPNLSARALRQADYGAVCVCRAAEYDQLRNSMRSEWRGVLWVAEDTAILDASMDTVSSRKVRAAVKAQEPLQHLVGGIVANYFKANRIGLKMKGDEKWSEDEKYLPKIVSSSVVAASNS
mmetsp:Transcript_20043/g.28796  ORF Transcript_20043/g.28796 Transcript_20043/m.28796 type:complete len:434 (+) Transcript_20043:129-1430(+)|eukprot:CAMPEP_0185041138 /NCGR_PEP_ID=MMETSP1103-20130426/40032_1 /TAXON_ID=36769 /ORGANISM="Paraphysomonas bandaiensis, Strain Caron Lab Isolate" /LENGTH=433 /DNA_ID=CAMNT_0027580741 /DNA_START=84 /DNA_END=1385 /DNA_ORIENTATION=+